MFNAQMEWIPEPNLYLVVGLTLAAGVVTLLVWSLMFKEKDLYPDLPGPPRHFFWGNTRDLMRTPYYVLHLRWSREYGRIFKLRFLRNKWAILVTDPEIVKEVTTKHFRTLHDRPAIFPARDLDPRALLMGRGTYWESVRSAVLPLFHTVCLKKFGEIMTRSAIDLTKRVGELSAGGKTSINFLPLCQAMTLDVVGSSAFGIQLNMLSSEGNDEAGEFVRALGSQVSLIGKFRASRILSFLLPPLAPIIFGLAEALPWCQTDRQMAKNRGVILAKGKELVKRAREKHLRDGEEDAKDFISLLVATKTKDTGRPLTDEEIQALAAEFLIAGSETTAVTIAMAVYFLSLHPDKEAAVRTEIDGYYARLRAASTATEGQGTLEESHPTYEELTEFPYMEQVVQETLRLNPAGAVAMREIAADTELLGGKHCLRRGGRVVCSIYAMHRDPALFPEPEVFRPERFAPGSAENENRHPYAYVPFGAGPRMCIGHRFAMEEARLALVRLYKEFSFTLDKAKMGDGPLDIDAGLVLKPKNAIYVFAHRRVREGVSEGGVRKD